MFHVRSPLSQRSEAFALVKQSIMANRQSKVFMGGVSRSGAIKCQADTPAGRPPTPCVVAPSRSRQLSRSLTKALSFFAGRSRKFIRFFHLSHLLSMACESNQIDTVSGGTRTAFAFKRIARCVLSPRTPPHENPHCQSRRRATFDDCSVRKRCPHLPDHRDHHHG